MVDPSNNPSLMDDIPRGISDERFREQTAPQSRFIKQGEILKHASLQYDPKDPGGKILLGAIGNQLLGIDDNRHILTIGGSRSGKSVTVINNLFFYQGSVICTDPKGELASLTAQVRADLGQKIYVLDPFNIVKGEAAKYRAKFNPMSILQLNNPFIVENALQIIDALIISSVNEKDPHWNEAASHLMMGIMLFVSTDKNIPPNDKHLGTVRHFLNRALAITEQEDENGKAVVFYTMKNKINACIAHLQKDGFEDLADVIDGAISGFYDKGKEERGSVLSTARRHTQFLDFKSMKDVLSGHDFDLTDIKSDPNGITVYLVLPATMMSLCSRWLRLFINQLFDAVERVPEKPKVPILFCLDEFPVLGFMKQLQDATGQIASFGVRLWIIIQDWGQGKSLYGDRWESFAANAGILQAFGNVDLTTTEYLSKRLGKTIVEDRSISETSEDQRKKGLIGERASRQMYQLMEPREIESTFARSDKLKRQLILWAGVNPMIWQRVEYFDPKSPLNKQ